MEETEENILELLGTLKIEKKSGELDDSKYFKSQNNTWRHRLEYATLMKFMIHQNEEIRKQALELLTISKKSTQSFTQAELDLIILCLNYNIGEKWEFVPFIKRILKRINDSYAVSKRQVDRLKKIEEFESANRHLPKPNPHSVEESVEDLKEACNTIASYKEFITSLHSKCIKNLYINAVNARKKVCLQILCLMEEILNVELKHCLWNKDKVKELLECLLLDTYELNKEMAFRLIKTLDFNLLELDSDESILEMVKVALEMGNSIRPIDCITAAYMLKITMLTPKVLPVLLRLVDPENISGCINEQITLHMIVLLMKSLKKPLQLAQENIVTAASKHSLYGYPYCIQSILRTIDMRTVENVETWKRIIDNLIEMCFELNYAVFQIVNNSSPEGHLPMDLNPNNLNCPVPKSENLQITPQMVLLCSWRTVKEVSLLFGYLTGNMPIDFPNSKIGLITLEQIEEIGDHLVTLLCETKHRGAFEQAHVGFGQLCNRLWHQTEADLTYLPKKWLRNLLLAIVGLTSENSKLCATRRSAGVPFMVQALVTSEICRKKDSTKFIFHPVMRILLKVIQLKDDGKFYSDLKNLLLNEPLLFGDNIVDKTTENCNTNCNITEVKTHALNILRALFKHCQLGDLVQEYVTEGLIVAIKSYDGKSWAERNAATLLFSSLVIRIFGVQRTKDYVNLTTHNKMTGKIFFEKYPGLLPFMLEELRIYVNQHNHLIKPNIQSFLLVLSRLYPSYNSATADEKWQIHEFINLVSQCGRSRVCKTRELAARALTPLLTEQNICATLVKLLNTILTERNFNAIHGFMLQVLELIRSQQFTKVHPPEKEIQDFIKHSNAIFADNLESTNNRTACFPIASVSLDILTELVKLDSNTWIFTEVLDSLLERVCRHLVNRNLLKDRPGNKTYEVSAMNLLLAAVRSPTYNKPVKTCSYFWKSVLSHFNAEVQTVAWSHMIYIIRDSKDSTLFDLGILEAIESIHQLIEDPDLQDAIFEYLSIAVVDIDANSSHVKQWVNTKDVLCNFIIEELCLQTKDGSFYERGSFFKLLGNAYGQLSQGYKISSENKAIIYDTFSSNSWMESGNLDCRIGVSEVLWNLYTKFEESEDFYFVLEWWSTLFNLLLDDNIQVRQRAAIIVAKIPPSSEIQCETDTLNQFFEKFTSAMKHCRWDVVVAVFLSWTIAAANRTPDEMDESDVFNKSSNYEVFEPLRIMHLCIQHMELICRKTSSIKEPFPSYVKRWLCKQLQMENVAFQSLNYLILHYEESVPKIDRSLKDILDPTYTAKLTQTVAYSTFRSSLQKFCFTQF